MNLEKYLRVQGDGLEINDSQGELQSLPDHFFDDYLHIKCISIYSASLSALPASFDKLIRLNEISLYKTKFKTLPNAVTTFKELKGLFLQTNSIDLNKEAIKLANLPKLTFLNIHGYKGKSFPANIALLKNLRKVLIGGEVEKKLLVKEVFSIMAKLPLLEELILNIPIYNSYIDEDFIQLDHLSTCRGHFKPFLHKTEDSPLLLGRMKNILFDRPIDEKLKTFRNKFNGRGLSNEYLDILFGIHIKNYTALNNILPNVLKDVLQEKKAVNLILLDKPKGESAKSIKERLAAAYVTLDNPQANENIVVVGIKTELEAAEPYVLKGYRVITVDQLKDALVSPDTLWLLQKENEALNNQLLQLLASNQTENYQIAFQMIESGGANRIIQSVLAALMLSHPEPSIQKSAEKLYDKYGSQPFTFHAKNSKTSLRKPENTEKKADIIVAHPDIDAFTFRLMHHRIAGANKNIADIHPTTLRIKNVSNLILSATLPFFNHLYGLHFDNCPGMQFEKAIPLLKQLTGCKVLWMNNCKINISPSIGELSHLQILNLAYNTIESPQALQSLKTLTALNLEGTKITDWHWLSHLEGLTYLNINNCALTSIPTEIYSLKNLRYLEAKQNKITQISEAITDLKNLASIDLSNNHISCFPYCLGRLVQLEDIVLRSNFISNFDASEIITATNRTTFKWKMMNLSKNKLRTFSFGDMLLPSLGILDISYNDIDVLDDSIFRYKALYELYADHNQISVIPPSITTCEHFSKLWLHNNVIARLEAYMARVYVRNCDLSDNQISFIHPEFNEIGKENYARLYWKIRNNPISSVLNNFGGLVYRK